MPRHEIKALSDFIRASRNQPQSSILIEFLRTIIKGKHISESGSVLVNRPVQRKLELFNESNFLYEEGFLPREKPWTKIFDYGDGIAGLAFRTKVLQVANNVNQNPMYVERDGDVPICHMVCAPIQFSDGRPQPFGVASFHNSQEKDLFTEDEVTLITAYTETLGLMLEISEYKLDWEKSKRVFIVHGHDRSPLYQLENILRGFDLEPIVMRDEPKSGHELLEMLEDLIAGCRGGFVLITPDDVGYPKATGEIALSPRARQNVIFESGVLTSIFRGSKKVCFLIRRPLELPSDMNGLLYEEMEDELNRYRIERVLKSWGIIPESSRSPVK